MIPVLRWAGSKRKLLNDLRALSPPLFGRYIEPFAGSAVLFFDLLPKRALLGDINPEVIATYVAIRDTPTEVSLYLDSIPKTREAYYVLRGLDPSELNAPQRAARLIYLMKACFNGVYRTNRKGCFNVPLGNRFFALPAPAAIEAASLALREVKLLCSDFMDTLAAAKKGDFVYLDPPYSDGSRFRGEYSYQGAFTVADQVRLIGACKELTRKKVRILLSFKECDEVSGALKGWGIRHLDVSRSVAGFAHARRTAQEILAYNF